MKQEFKIPNFDKATHTYSHPENGKPLTGVTSVLRVIAKPALIQWAANEAVNYVEKYFIPLVDKEGIKTAIVIRVLQEARTAHRRKKEEAGAKGTDVHAEVEQLIKIWIGGGDTSPTHKNPQVQKFIDWATSVKAKFLASEKIVWSEEFWLAGTLDFIVEIKGKKYLGDLKTSSAIYPEMWAQCAAYRMMCEDKDFAGSVIVRAGKKGDFEAQYQTDYERDKSLFLGALQTYRALRKFEL